MCRTVQNMTEQAGSFITNFFVLNCRPENYPNAELCSVYYAPLNFRDIMLATGKLPPDALPGDLAGQVNKKRF